jgi:hypothetical protein
MISFMGVSHEADKVAIFNSFNQLHVDGVSLRKIEVP